MLNIQSLRGDKTQSALAEELGVDRSTIAKWETGKANPRADLLPKLAKALGCSVDDLFAESNQILND